MSNILFIGAGNMGQAIINGVLGKNQFNNQDIFIYEVSENIKNEVINKFKVNYINKIDSKIGGFDIIVLAVKPQVFKNFDSDDEMKKLKDYVTANQTIVSIM
ncbi:MAG TPA: NAD(P)-binding domain-containing protein, partial [Spirochaetota bacterium]|nr:NAD(P)-binding domain-containing protein [Spirochaetota bacterium]